VAAESRARSLTVVPCSGEYAGGSCRNQERSPTGPWLDRAVGVRPTLMPEAHQALRRARVGEAVERTGRVSAPDWRAMPVGE